MLTQCVQAYQYFRKEFEKGVSYEPKVLLARAVLWFNGSTDDSTSLGKISQAWYEWLETN